MMVVSEKEVKKCNKKMAPFYWGRKNQRGCHLDGSKSIQASESATAIQQWQAAKERMHQINKKRPLNTHARKNLVENEHPCPKVSVSQDEHFESG